MAADDWLIYGIGFVGQLFFFGRFIVQWWASEKAGRTVVPRIFWDFSIIGALITLGYSIARRDPVFILGTVVALAIYGRNYRLARNG